MRTAVVDNPKDTASIIVRRAGHDLLYQTVERSYARGRFATAKDAGMMNIKRGHVGPRSTTAVLMLDTHRAAASWRKGGMLAPPRLNAGLLVGGDDELIAFQGLFLPAALIEIEDSAGLGGKGGISWKDPTSVIPGADGVGVEPSPDGASRY